METDKLLQNIYKGTTMAVDSINNLMEYVDNDDMLNLLLDEQEGYYKIKAKVKQKLEKMGITELYELKMARSMAKMTMKMRMSVNRTKEKIAKMLYRGADMGLEELAENENLLKKNGEVIPEIAKEYKQLLISNQKQLEKYL